MAQNMEHCRFINTLEALRECQDALSDENAERLSPAEEKAKDNLLKLCREIADDWLGPNEED